ncbi:MAG: response regulator [bacterium]|nr:response regulator [bacterium]
MRLLVFNLLMITILCTGFYAVSLKIWQSEIDDQLLDDLTAVTEGYGNRAVDPTSAETSLLVQDIDRAYTAYSQSCKQARIGLAIVVLLGICGAILSLYISLGRLLRPIQTLTRISRNVALGDFSERVPVQANDELGQLSKQFNRMCSQLQKSQSQLVQAEKLKSAGEMAAGIAHDFNNVLFAISARLELVHSDLVDGNLEGKDLLQSLEIMMQAAADGAETVRKIREISNPKESRGLTTIQLNETCHQALEMSHDKCKASEALHGTKIKVREIFGEIPPILGNPVEMREMLTNLINNSIDAMPRGGTLIVSSADEGEWVRVTVADTGEGMDENTKQKVLDPFFTTKGAHGTGLGMSMVYGIIKRMKGEIRIESVLKQGTAVSLFFPAKAGLSLPDAVVEEQESKEPIPSRRVLIVDDEPYVAEGLAGLMRHLGQATEVANSGKEALSILETQTFDLVFTDLGMPEMTGWDLIRVISQKWPKLPVVLVTGWGDYIDDEELLSKSVSEVISKPASRNKLREVLVGLNSAVQEPVLRS